MSDKASGTSGGIGFCGLLTIAFIVLKLLDKIDWSWWWVLAPSWIPFGLAIAFVLVVAIACGGASGIGAIADAISRRRRRKRIESRQDADFDINVERARMRRLADEYKERARRRGI